MFKTRLISSILLLPLLIAILYYKGIVLFIALTVISIIGLREFYNSVKAVSIKPIEIYGYAVTIIYFVSVFFCSSILSFSALLALSFMVLIAYVVLQYNNTVVDIVMTVFGVFYVSFFLSHFLLILELNYNDIILLLPFVTAWGTDTFAYIVGLTMGKRKLCPLISPKKSVEGAIGGCVGCTALTIVFGIIVNLMGYNIHILHFVVVGIICGIFSQFGDLTASLWKRYTGIKDFGKIIPGHGGVLDRFDSVLFTVPIVYYYFFYFVK